MTSPLLAHVATAALPFGALAAGAIGPLVRSPRAARRVLVGVGAVAAAAAALDLVGPAAAGGRSALGGWSAVLGLAALGAAVGGLDRATAFGRAVLLLALAALLDGAPTGWGLFVEAPPFGAAETARLLDASPRVLAMEAAGADWMRDPAVYGPAGADRIGPELRAPYPVRVAGLRVLLMGCVALAARVLLSPTRGTPLDPWHPDASTAPSRPR